ncbi:MAG: DUF3592 domain-containing protein [Ferruginibacter sp.]
MVYGILLTIGLTLCTISGFVIKEKILFIKNSEKSTGKVFEIKEEEGGGETNGTVYRPYFKFKSSQNIEYTYKYYIATSPIKWEVGDEATIIYNPDNPNHASIYTYWGIFILPIILLTIAAPLLVISGGYFWAQTLLK